MEDFKNKTVVIYETTEYVSFYLEEGDLTKFEQVFINSTNTGLEEELGLRVFSNEINTQQLNEAIKKGSKVVHCGFMF